jgi:crossover junction endodeoxyribonuclease RuvC
MRILGIDPGLNTTGYAVLDSRSGVAVIVEAGVIRSSGKRKSSEIAKRLRALYDGVVEIIEQLRPGVLVVEQLFAHYKHPRTAILMGHARGAILLAGAKHDLPVVSYSATRVKKTVTGGGHASKPNVQAAILREFGLAKMPEPADVADAMAIALCHHFASQRTAEEAG